MGKYKQFDACSPRQYAFLAFLKNAGTKAKTRFANRVLKKEKKLLIGFYDPGYHALFALNQFNRVHPCRVAGTDSEFVPGITIQLFNYPSIEAIHNKLQSLCSITDCLNTKCRATWIRPCQESEWRNLLLSVVSDRSCADGYRR